MREVFFASVFAGARGACGDETFKRHDGVHAAGAEAVEVECDELEAELPQSLSDQVARGRSDEPRQFGEGNFDPGEIAHLVTDAKLAEAELFAEELFRLIDALHPLGGDGQSIRDAAGKAGRGRLVPHGQFQ